jgi:hypothetical protein
MSEANHTPGPFKVESTINDEYWAIRADDGSAEPIIALVKKVGTTDGEIYQDEAEANARMLAAAPDMLAELRQCCVEIEEAANVFDHKGLPSLASVYRKAAERITATIAKAEGKK